MTTNNDLSTPQQLRNPFYHRGPVRAPAEFYNRERELLQAFGLLQSAQSVSIVGPRRIGKTSLLLHIKDPEVCEQHGLSRAVHCFVYLDGESWGSASPGDLYDVLLSRTRQAVAAAGYDTGVSVPSGDHSTYRALDRSVEAVAGLGIRLVIILDEFEALAANPNLDATFFSGLRGLATSHNVAYITASTAPLLSLTYNRSSTLSSPFFNFFAQIPLGLFTEKAARELLAGRVAQAGGAFAPDTVRFLLSLAGPHPLLLQIAGYHAYEHGAADGAPLGEASQDQMRRDFLTEAQAHWTYAWHNLTTEQKRLLALLPVARHMDVAGLRRLEQECLVRTAGSDTLYLSPAFQQFVNWQQVPGLLQAPPVTVDPTERLALLRGTPLTLSPIDFELLVHLIAHPGKILSHDQLGNGLWPDEYQRDPSPERLKARIKILRRALGDDADVIKNVRSIGYMFATESPR